jgi:hypothetical protein
LLQNASIHAALFNMGKLNLYSFIMIPVIVIPLAAVFAACIGNGNVPQPAQFYLIVFGLYFYVFY